METVKVQPPFHLSEMEGETGAPRDMRSNGALPHPWSFSIPLSSSRPHPSTMARSHEQVSAIILVSATFKTYPPNLLISFYFYGYNFIISDSRFIHRCLLSIYYVHCTQDESDLGPPSQRTVSHYGGNECEQDGHTAELCICDSLLLCIPFILLI